MAAVISQEIAKLTAIRRRMTRLMYPKTVVATRGGF
jgi:hypothetical protein